MKEQIEDMLRALGATHVEVRFGPEAYITFNLDGEPDGWDVVDDRRRYPHQVAASLDLETAARHARSLGRAQK